MAKSFNFLNRYQIWDYYPKYRVSALENDKYGKACAITDFSILLGGFVDNECHTKEGNTDKDRTGLWYIRLYHTQEDALLNRTVYDGMGDDDGTRLVSTKGFKKESDVNRRDVGARPAIKYSSIKSEVSNEIIDEFNVKVVEYGEYPQTIVDETFSSELEASLNSGQGIRKTGRIYTTDSVDFDDFDTAFKPRKHEEFEYKGKRYIRIVGDYNGEGEKLSDGRIVESGKPYWVAVEPIKWLVDEKIDIALSKEIIFAGVQYDYKKDYKGRFGASNIKNFMDRYFAKEITQKENDKVDLIENPVEEQDEYSYDGRLKKGFGINKAFAEISLEELDELRKKLDLVPEGTTERENLEAVYKWICDYYENNYKKILKNTNTVEVATYREVVNNFTLDLDRVLYSSFNETNNNDLYMDVSSYGDESNNRGLRM